MPKQGLSSSVIEPEPAKSFKSWARSSSELQELLKSLMTRRSGSFQRKIWSVENLFPLDFWRKSFSRFFSPAIQIQEKSLKRRNRRVFIDFLGDRGWISPPPTPPTIEMSSIEMEADQVLSFHQKIFNQIRQKFTKVRTDAAIEWSNSLLEAQ